MSEVQNEAATVQVVVNENCYVSIRVPGKDKDGKDTMVEKCMSGHYEVQAQPGGKSKRVWVGDKFWAAPSIVNKWTVDMSSGQNPRPVVTIMGNRTIEDAKEGVEPKRRPPQGDAK